MDSTDVRAIHLRLSWTWWPICLCREKHSFTHLTSAKKSFQTSTTVIHSSVSTFPRIAISEVTFIHIILAGNLLYAINVALCIWFSKLSMSLTIRQYNLRCVYFCLKLRLYDHLKSITNPLSTSWLSARIMQLPIDCCRCSSIGNDIMSCGSSHVVGCSLDAQNIRCGLSYTFVYALLIFVLADGYTRNNSNISAYQ